MRLRALCLAALAMISGACGNLVEADISDLVIDGAATEIQGTLSAYYAEDPIAGHGELRLELVERLGSEDEGLNAQRFQLDLGAFSEEQALTLRDGDLVQLRGVIEGDMIRVGGERNENALTTLESLGESMQVLETAPAATEQRTLVIIANFTDAAVACSADAVRNLMFGGAGSISDYFTTVSNGSIAITGDVVGPFEINYSNSSCDTNGWAAAANSAATSAGVNVGAYTRLIYVLPHGSCGYAGWGTIGGSPSRSWITGYCQLPDVYAHELGHNMSMHHAMTSGSEYGDRSCIMGIGGLPLRHLNGPHTVQMGWRKATQATTGSFDISALASSATANVLRIAIDSSNGYFISFRDVSGYDRTLESGYRYRTAIHSYTSGAAKTLLHASLADGERFQDTQLGLTITQSANTGSGSSVQIAMACAENAPSLTLSPASRFGLPGATLSYTVSITNRDGPGCTARDFDLSVNSAWSATLASTRINLLPGASSTTTLQVTSPTDITSGQVSFSVEARSAGALLATASGIAGVDGTAPTAPSDLTAIGDKRQVALRWSASVDDSGVVSYRIWRNGSQIATVGTTSFSDRNANSRSTYTYEVDAIDAAGNVSAKSAPATITASTKGGGRR